MAISSMKYTRTHTNTYTQSCMYACMHIRRLEHMSCEENPFSDRTYVKQQFFNCLNFFITVFHWKHMKTALCHFPFPFCFKEGKPRKNYDREFSQKKPKIFLTFFFTVQTLQPAKSSMNRC